MKYKMFIVVIVLMVISCKESESDRIVSLETAKEHFFNDRFNESLRDLNILIEQDPSNKRYYYLRYTVYGALGRYSDEVKDLTTIIQWDSKIEEESDSKLGNNAIFYYERSIAYVNLNKPQKSLEDINYAIENKNGLGDIYDPYNLALAYCAKGSVLYKLNNYSEAKKYYDLALKTNNDTIPYITSNALVGFANLEGDNKKKLMFLNKAIKADSTAAIAYGARGIYYYNNSNINFAQRDFNTALKIEPNYGDITFLLGQLYANELDNKDSAIFYLRKTLILEPQHIERNIISHNLEILESPNFQY